MQEEKEYIYIIHGLQSFCNNVTVIVIAFSFLLIYLFILGTDQREKKHQYVTNLAALKWNVFIPAISVFAQIIYFSRMTELIRVNI